MLPCTLSRAPQCSADSHGHRHPLCRPQARPAVFGVREGQEPAAQGACGEGAFEQCVCVCVHLRVQDWEAQTYVCLGPTGAPVFRTRVGADTAECKKGASRETVEGHRSADALSCLHTTCKPCHTCATTGACSQPESSWTCQQLGMLGGWDGLCCCEQVGTWSKWTTNHGVTHASTC